MSHVLVTGFEPFDGDTMNPSGEAARRLDGRTIEGRRVTSLVLPCAFGSSVRELRGAMRKYNPELVLCLGQAGGRAELSLERIAINVDDARIPDNDGAQPIDEPIVRSGPAAYWTTLPIKAITRELGRAGVPAVVSQSAGTFVCNHVFYALMRTLARRKRGRGGFVHVPLLREQAVESREGEPSMELDEIVRGLEIAIGTALTSECDVRVTGGALH